MKHFLTFGVVVLALVGSGSAFAQSKAKAENVPTIPHMSVPNFFKLPPDLYFGEGIGIATNSKGNVFVYHRSGDTRLFMFDKDGKFVKEIGQGMYGMEFAHQVRVDKYDNIWVIDEGTNMVIKMNPEGTKVLLTLGRRPEMAVGAFDSTLPPAAPEKYKFGRPTDVTWDPQDNIFISDGYVNSRVVKYDKNGRYLKEFGTARAGSGPNQLSTPHSITADRQGNIYVGDRGNARVQVLDNELNLKASYGDFGNPWAVCVSTDGPKQYLFVSNSNPDSNTPASSWDITGEIYKLELDGTVIGKFGKAGKGLGEFSTVHEIDCRNPNEIFVSEISAWRAQKILVNPPRQTTSSGR
ncbi:MAG: peptidyl-alpha-hydroxyglycine alpha-amidating lyase family protein [Acidobacteriaceae bacterium]|jgi:DNA-binding beta-propeller fold protein YncE|nr:peptidyl-alpha-hydroxyglycine alpha-amidating lyase family protein [Acidobacteriaceae bacterium]